MGQRPGPSRWPEITAPTAVILAAVGLIALITALFGSLPGRQLSSAIILPHPTHPLALDQSGAAGAGVGTGAQPPGTPPASLQAGALPGASVGGPTTAGGAPVVPHYVHSQPSVVAVPSAPVTATATTTEPPGPAETTVVPVSAGGTGTSYSGSTSGGGGTSTSGSGSSDDGPADGTTGTVPPSYPVVTVPTPSTTQPGGVVADH